MKIVNQEVLDRFRGPGKCDMCGKRCLAREPHHLWAKGMGGGGCLDIPINLISLGSAFQCDCHRKVHDGNLPSREFVKAAARREGVSVDNLESVVYLLKRLGRDPRAWQIDAQIETLGDARPLAISILKEILPWYCPDKKTDS